jgi:hypothetical protein
MGHDWDQPGDYGRARRGGAGTSGMGRKVGDRQKTRERSGSMIAGEYDFTGNAAFQRWCEEWAREALRVLKPGGHLISFGGTRTYHRLVTGIEDAGFEIRDSLQWLFGSGFPKSLNVGDGRGTALKPGHEPIVLARAPFRGTVAANVEAHGTGALNIARCSTPSWAPDDPVQRTAV